MAKFLNRPILFAIDFTKPTDDRGRFSNMYDLTAWCRQHGYTVGNTCAEKPTAVMIGDIKWIEKWVNLTKDERNTVDGVMIPNLATDGYTLYLYNISNVLRNTFPSNVQHVIDHMRILGKDGSLEPLPMTPAAVEWLRLLGIAQSKGMEITYLGTRSRKMPKNLSLQMQEELKKLPDFLNHK